MKRILCALLVAAMLTGAAPQAYADDAPDGADGGMVTRGEFEELRAAYEALQAQVESMRASQDVDSLVYQARELSELQQQVDSLIANSEAPSTSRMNFLLTGYADAGFTDTQRRDSSFSAGFFPVFVWKLSDPLLFEAELHITGGGDHGSGVELSYAHLSYVANDWLTAGAGKFLSPFGAFQERLHPSWINKLPTNPIVYGHGGGLAPEAMTGIQLRGAVPVGSQGAKLTYAGFLVNGPQLALAEEGEEPADDGGHAHVKAAEADGHGELETGLLAFGDGSDNNNNKTLGGRVALLPQPWVEFGASFMTGQAGPSDSHLRSVDFDLFGLDLVVQRPCEFLQGNLEFRSEWIWSDVDRGDLPFDNDRDGGFFQLAYRPDLDSRGLPNDLELIVRYDTLDNPGGESEQHDVDAWTFGLAYWIAPNQVLKLGWEKRSVDHDRDSDALLLQFAVGF